MNFVVLLRKLRLLFCNFRLLFCKFRLLFLNSFLRLLFLWGCLESLKNVLYISKIIFKIIYWTIKRLIKLFINIFHWGWKKTLQRIEFPILFFGSVLVHLFTDIAIFSYWFGFFTNKKLVILRILFTRGVWTLYATSDKRFNIFIFFVHL